MSPRVTRANSRYVWLNEKASAVPYFLSSRIPLGNASNLIGLNKAVDILPKKEKTARLKKERTKAKDAGLKAPLTKNKNVAVVCETVKVAKAIRRSYLEGQEVTGSMRAVAIDWLMWVQRAFKLREETMFMTINIIDGFLQNNPVPKRYFQLLGVTAMLIASKYEEMYPPTVGDFAFVTDGTYTCADIRRMERIILKKVNYSLGKPVAPHFLHRAYKVGQSKGAGVCNVSYGACCADYDLVHVAPSLIAAAAFAASLRILESGKWSSILQHYTGYKEETLAPMMQGIVRILEKVTEECKLQEMKSRYAKVSTSVSGAGAKGVSSENIAKLLDLF